MEIAAPVSTRANVLIPSMSISSRFLAIAAMLRGGFWAGDSNAASPLEAALVSFPMVEGHGSATVGGG